MPRHLPSATRSPSGSPARARSSQKRNRPATPHKSHSESRMFLKSHESWRGAVPLTLAVAGAIAASQAMAADAAEILKAGATIEIPGSTGKFDFLRIDDKRRRLLGAHENDGTWDVFDLDKAAIITRVKVGGAVDTALDPATGQ